MKTSVLKKLCAVLLLFCFADLYGQQNEKVKELLKGLAKADPQKMQQMDESVLSSLPFYSPEGNLIEQKDMLMYFPQSAPPKYAPEPYVDNNGKPVLFLLRKHTPLEQKQMEAFFKQASGGSDVVGSKAPAFSVQSIDGKSFDLKKLKGKLVVINFWFIACKPCVMEIPELSRIAKKYKNHKDVVFLGFARDSKKRLKNFLQKTPFAYNIVAKSGALAAKYKVVGFPTNIVIDKEGKYLLYATGYNPGTIKNLEKLIESKLKE